MFKLRFQYSSIWPEIYQIDRAWELAHQPKVDIDVWGCSVVGEATQLQPELLEKSYVEPEKKTSGSADRTNRTGKIYYQMNFLSSMSEQDGMLMRALCASQEL